MSPDLLSSSCMAVAPVGPSNYVLITSARNEEQTIGKTMAAVHSQTILPAKWVIVSDGSRDRTDSFVINFAERAPYIEFVRRKSGEAWGFASKVASIREGEKRLALVNYDYIGILDADISFCPEYFETLMDALQDREKLGITGGMIHELRGRHFVPLKYNRKSVAGAVQLFRRRCYEQIGGYLPLRYGGIDAVAEVSARMHGWEVESLENLAAFHHRRIGTTRHHILRSRLRFGIREYHMGTHPVFLLLKSLHRWSEKPIVIGSFLTLLGYTWSHLTSEPGSVPEEIVRYTRREQMSRMTGFLASVLKRARRTVYNLW